MTRREFFEWCSTQPIDLIRGDVPPTDEYLDVLDQIGLDVAEMWIWEFIDGLHQPL